MTYVSAVSLGRSQALARLRFREQTRTRSWPITRRGARAPVEVTVPNVGGYAMSKQLEVAATPVRALLPCHRRGR